MEILPRLIRLRDAPKYLGMDKNRFNKEVRPNLIEIPIGSQGIGFDRIDLDAWLTDYKEKHGRPGKGGRINQWGANKLPVSSKGVKRGTSTKESGAIGFAKAVERAKSKKQNNS